MMTPINWVTIEINGDASKLPQNGAWCSVDVDMPTNMRRRIRFDSGRFYDENNHAVNPKAVLNWHMPMDAKDMAALRNTIVPVNNSMEEVIAAGSAGIEQEAIAA